MRSPLVPTIIDIVISLETSSAASFDICCRFNCIYVKASESLQAMILIEIFSLVKFCSSITCFLAALFDRGDPAVSAIC